MNKYLIIIVSLSIILLASCIGDEPTENRKEESGLFDTQTLYFPTEEWRISTPETQGVDSEKLIEAFEEIDQWHSGVNSVLITRNGYIVAEKYYEEYNKDIKQWVYSATKGVTSALTGIALEMDFFQLEDTVIDFFHTKKIKNMDERKSSITVEDLLNMRSGISFDDLLDFHDTFTSTDPLQTILDLPMKEHPNTSYNYSSADSHLLSAIIQTTSGMSTVEFANTYLFEPLHIHAEFVEFNNVASGGNGLIISPRDMAKIGWLYLNEGRWEDKQIIPEDWIASSTTSSIDEFFTNRVSFGYHWFINEVNNQTVYYTHGSYGQYIISIPDLNMNVVFTSSHQAPRFDQLVPNVLEKIMKAAISEEPLEENKEGYEKLRNVLEKEEVISRPTELPKEVSKINDTIYSLHSNDFEWSEVSLSFPNEEIATMKLKYTDGENVEYSIGIDTIPRLNEINSNVISKVGFWQDPNTFIQRVKYLDYLAEYSLTFSFDENYEKVTITEIYDGSKTMAEGTKTR